MTNKSKNGNILAKEPYKGVRDFYPADQAVQNYIFKKMRKTVQSFGYVEYASSLLEPTELYEIKSGEELVKEQTYSFKDRGGRDVTLRPEMTPSVARMVARRKRELGFPLRWYSVANAFRYERPQRGRLREHWQLNADLFGVDGLEADAEIITLACRILKDLGAKDGDFEVKINYAGVLKQYLKREFGLDKDDANSLAKVIDRYGKISSEDFEKRVKKIIKEEKTLVLSKALENRQTVLSKSYIDIEYLGKLKEKLYTLNINNIVIDPYLTRGFDYYTGIVFEVFDTNPENKRSLFGGGRYDNLMEIFGEEKIAAVGFGVGDVTIRDFLEGRKLLPEYISTTDLFLCTLDKKNIPFAQGIAGKLRVKGVNVSVNLTDKKVGDQIKVADKQKIPYVICIGEEEEKNGQFKVKELKSGKEKEVNENDIITIVSKKPI
jgi:histidyl-tRNA synthetase